MRGDLIRNYKMIIKGRAESDSEESQPFKSSASSTPNFGSFNDSDIFKQDSYSEMDAYKSQNCTLDFGKTTEIPPILIQKKLNRQILYNAQDLGYFEDFRDYSQDILSDESDSVGRTGHTHNSLVTIFAIWNTTVGTSLLAMSWGIEKTGLFPAIMLNVLLAAICLFTSYTLLKINAKHGILGSTGEVSDLCRSLLGRWAEIIAKIFSLIVLIGANVVYWILMSNFFYNSVHFIYGSIFNVTDSSTPQQSNGSSVICPKNDIAAKIDAIDLTTFEKIWDLYSTVPVVLALIMFPMLNWKSPTFFTKFNSLGTFSILFLIGFVGAKAWSWGVNVTDWGVEWHMKPTFLVLSGMLSMSYFIHNIIISIMRNNKNQQHNGRDLSIAFALITFTYLFIGVVFYIAFPLPKFCIEDNILNNFDKFDTLTIVARILLLFQLFTVFPLMSYMLRSDVLANIKMIFHNSYGDFNLGRVMLLNLTILTICILFACFMPRIGTLIRYTGALSGLVYVFMLPSLLKIASLRKERALTFSQLIFYVSVMIVGVVNLLSQFFISDQ